MRLLTDKTMKYELTINAKPKIGKPDMAAWLAKHGDWEERVTHLDELVDIAFEAGRQSVMDKIYAAEWHAYLEGLQMLLGKVDAAVSLAKEDLSESIVSTHRHHRQVELAEIKN